MLFTRDSQRCRERLRGKAESGSRNITVNEGCVPTTMTAVPCYHTHSTAQLYVSMTTATQPYHNNKQIHHGFIWSIELFNFVILFFFTIPESRPGFVFSQDLPQCKKKKNPDVKTVGCVCLARSADCFPPLLELTAFRMCLTNPIHNESPDKQSSKRLPGYPTESRE